MVLFRAAAIRWHSAFQVQLALWSHRLRHIDTVSKRTPPTPCLPHLPCGCTCPMTGTCSSESGLQGPAEETACGSAPWPQLIGQEEDT